MPQGLTPGGADTTAETRSGSGGSPDAPSEGRFAAGTLVARRYRIVRLLGRGGMGTVYQADDLKLDVPVALKFLLSWREREPEKLALFLNEVRLARQITHPNVCRVYDVDEVDGLHFLSMEYVAGEDLASLLKRVGRLPRDRAIRVGLEICRGLEAAHERGILHRDLKPANLMIDADGRARITDFGLAFSAGSTSDSALPAGTPVYMAPEQIHGQASVQSDLYALGLVLYELFTGERAFKTPQIFQLQAPDALPAFSVEGLDPGVENVILSCLEADPERRPRSGRAVAAALERGAEPPWQAAPGLGIPHRPHWVLEESLGRGGFGETWLAVHQKTRDRRVFKFCHDATKLRAFQREITLFRLLKEQLGKRGDITSILDWCLDEPPYFIEAEHAAGGNLEEWAKRQGGLDAVPLTARLEIVAQMATALAAAHSVGVMHKDVKPANVLIQEDSEGKPHAQLCDFGIGGLTERERLEAAGITMLGLTETEDSSSSYAGTRLYMAPELFEGKSTTLGGDVYALGVVLFQMVVADFSRVLAPGWQREVDDELLREDVLAAVERAPERRLGSAQLAERLRSLAERRERRAADRRLRQEAKLTLRRARQRRRWATASLGVVFLVALVLSIGFEQGAKAARTALIEQTLESHQGMARIAAAAVDRNLAAVKRRVEREAGNEELRALLLQPLSAQSAVQAHTDQLYERYKDRHFYSWVAADRQAVARARSPFDSQVVGRSYGYREWFSGREPQDSPPPPQGALPAAGEAVVEPRREPGLTLAFQSTAEGNPVLMSVAAPIRSDAPEVLGVLAATLHLGTFNEWLGVAESRSPGEACPERFVLLIHRGQLLRHPCPEPEAPQPPVDADVFLTEAVRELLRSGVSRGFRDPLRPDRFVSQPADLAVAAPLSNHPQWTVVVVQDRSAALRPLSRLTEPLRRLGLISVGLGVLVLALLGGLLWRAGRGDGGGPPLG